MHRSPQDSEQVNGAVQAIFKAIEHVKMIEAGEWETRTAVINTLGECSALIESLWSEDAH